MLLEATAEPIVYRWPGGCIRLEPCRPTEVEDSRAFKILEKAQGKVRVSNREWLKMYEAILNNAEGVRREDSRHDEIMAALNTCDELFLAGDVKAFNEQIDRLNVLIEELK